MSSMMTTLLTLGLLAGAAYAVINRCNEPFAGIGLCPEDTAAGEEAVEEPVPCCSCTESGGKITCTGTDKDGESFTKTYKGSLASAQLKCDEDCVVTEAEEVDDDDDDDDNNKSKTYKKVRKQLKQKSKSIEKQYKKITAKDVAATQKANPGARVFVPIVKRSKYAHSYFADTYNIRPYTSYRGRMSL